jgi:hypothetical protein
MADPQNIIEVTEEIVSIIQINQGPKGDPGADGVGAAGINSLPPIGGYTIKNIYLNASKHIVIVYDETPVS